MIWLNRLYGDAITINVTYCDEGSSVHNAILRDGYYTSDNVISVPIDDPKLTGDLKSIIPFITKINPNEYYKIEKVVVKYKLEKFLDEE